MLAEVMYDIVISGKDSFTYGNMFPDENIMNNLGIMITMMIKCLLQIYIKWRPKVISSMILPSVGHVSYFHVLQGLLCPAFILF